MIRSQQYFGDLFDRISAGAISTDDQRSLLQRLKDRLVSSGDLDAELRRLYAAKEYSDLALSLMWISEKVENDPTKIESTPEEADLVLSLFRRANGEVDVSPVPSLPTTEEAGPGESMTSPVTLAPESVEAAPVVPTELAATAGAGEREFAGLLEKFLEAVQSGSDERSALMDQVVRSCDAVASSSGAAEYQEFCRLLKDFLGYITANQYLDDVRVMNILANIQDPFSRWANSAAEDRPAILEPGVEVLRDFKTMFE